MRKVILSIVIITICFSCQHKNSSNNKNIVGEKLIQKMEKDSGYIIKKDGLPFLLASSLTDTIGRSWGFPKDNDTIAKYYKVKQTGNTIICFEDYAVMNKIPQVILIEIKQDGTIIKKERFNQSYATCCWDDKFFGFVKYGSYFCLKNCEDGSGFCSSHLYLFKNVITQDSINDILENCWSSFGELVLTNLTSSIDLHDDYIIMHYAFEGGKLDDKSHYTAKEKKKFNIKYVLKNNKWITTDSTNLKILNEIY